MPLLANKMKYYFKALCKRPQLFYVSEGGPLVILYI